ncbi:MAG: NAD(P)-dependent oxidoreductase [Spirochaetales bacterium]|nr:NAD(P)-dependent oxidoreductase [Spirochaetales bacterium]
MNVLLTGADGFIGSAMRKHLISKGHSVTGIVFFKPDGGNDIRLDITQPEEFKKLSGKTFDAVVHAAGIIDQNADKRLIYAVNANGTRNLIEWVKGIRINHFIFFSSVSVYGLKTMGRNRREENTKTCYGPFALPYMKSKVMAERHVAGSGLPYTLLRLAPVLGRHDTYLSKALAPRLLDGKFFLCGSGDRLVSMLCIENLAFLLDLLLETGPLNGAFNCCDYHVPFKTLSKEYSRCLNVPFRPGKKNLLSLATHFNDKAYLLILTFSRFGAHFPDDKLHKVLPHTHPHKWQESVREACEEYKMQTSNQG